MNTSFFGYIYIYSLCISSPRLSLVRGSPAWAARLKFDLHIVPPPQQPHHTRQKNKTKNTRRIFIPSLRSHKKSLTTLYPLLIRRRPTPIKEPTIIVSMLSLTVASSIHPHLPLPPSLRRFEGHRQWPLDPSLPDIKNGVVPWVQEGGGVPEGGDALLLMCRGTEAHTLLAPGSRSSGTAPAMRSSLSCRSGMSIRFGRCISPGPARTSSSCRYVMCPVWS
jgi:hypothetical protein